MSKKEDVIEAEGRVVEVLPGTKFKVKITTGQIIECHISGKIRINKIKILPDDLVVVELITYDLTKGRIIFRKKEKVYESKSIS